LGLYTVQKSVYTLQGRIELESEVGRYTRVTVLLPYKAAG
jgi:sensor histidine kinase regulating citrate/malate metabolism